jgi:hypothetical protein
MEGKILDKKKRHLSDSNTRGQSPTAYMSTNVAGDPVNHSGKVTITEIDKICNIWIVIGCFTKGFKCCISVCTHDYALPVSCRINSDMYPISLSVSSSVVALYSDTLIPVQKVQLHTS